MIEPQAQPAPPAADGEPAFLEMNTRLQVEHPVTELVTGLDLVRLQILVAQGLPLPEEVLTAQLTGHAVEARLYAEDVPSGYLPVNGTVELFEIPAGVRVDSGVETGSVVGTSYDAMLAKVIAYGATREEACSRLAGALERTRVHGVTTNRDLLVRVLRSPEFLGGEVDTGYLDRHDPAVLGAPRADGPTRQTRRGGGAGGDGRGAACRQGEGEQERTPSHCEGSVVEHGVPSRPSSCRTTGTTCLRDPGTVGSPPTRVNSGRRSLGSARRRHPRGAPCPHPCASRASATGSSS